MINKLYQQYCISRAVTTDSRSITPGCIFFAFKGERVDGHTFVRQALDQGATYCVVSDPDYVFDDRCLLVSDVLLTLQALALFHRQHLTIPVVGITGTNGKTTTKELVNAVLGRRFRTHATKGNFNNHLGVPLTILSVPADTEIMIVEMGANHPGEIDLLCRIALPTCGLISSVGKAHLEGFGSFEGVVATKTELYRHLALDGNHGVAFVNADNDVLMQQISPMAVPCDKIELDPAYRPGVGVTDLSHRPNLSMITYGASNDAMVKGSLVGSKPYMKFYFEDDDTVYSVQTQLVGDYNFANAMAAVCVGRYFGVELFDIKEALESYTPSNNRSQFKRTSRNALLLDCYNANPTSMQAALQAFAALQSVPGTNGKKMVILGDMKELGAESEHEHRVLVDHLMQSPFQTIFLVGDNFKPHIDSTDTRFRWFSCSDEVKEYLAHHLIADMTILLKGSNANRLWTLEESL